MQTIAVVDYGMGNLRSVEQAVKAVSQNESVEVLITNEAATIQKATRVILPGQGSMPHCMAALEQSGLKSAVLHALAHKPVLGICVGMQMLLEKSEEGPSPGLGIIPGEVVRFSDSKQALKVPQMGWNQVNWTREHLLVKDIASGSYFYFVHSYYACVASDRDAIGRTEYSVTFTSALARDNIFATQFHPEKSAEPGLKLFHNFIHWNP